MANTSYSLAADFQEQKALLEALMSKKDEKPVEKKSRYDDKALEYVKKFIEDKKKKEQQSIDEYRSKI